MQETRIKRAGWSALIAAFAMIPETLLVTRYDAGLSDGLPLLAGLSLLMLLRVCAGAYALFRFRELLHALAQFEDTDRHIDFLILGGFALWLVLTLARVPGLFSPEVSMVLLLAVGLPLGVVSVQFGWRLLRVNSDLAGLKSVFCWTQIIAPLSFMTVILAPVGLLAVMLGLVLLGLILLKAEDSVPEFI